MGKSLEKITLLLELIAEAPRTLTELAGRSGLPKSTVHRLLGELLEQAFVTQVGKTYRLGVKLLELGEKTKRQLQLPQVADEHMRETAKQTSETVHLGALDGRDIVYLAKVEGSRGLQMASYVGLRSLAQTTALGKVLIAALPVAEWAAHFYDLEPCTPHTISDLEGFLAELGAVRREGYALDQEENEVGVRCVAAPVRDASGAVVAAISVSGAAVYISSDRQQALIPYVLTCARAISRDLGHDRHR